MVKTEQVTLVKGARLRVWGWGSSLDPGLE